MSKQKKSLVLVYTGDGKGKTSAAIGTAVRAIGAGQRVAFYQFIKTWTVSEHKFFENMMAIYGDKFTFVKGGKGFYQAGNRSAKNVSEDEHQAAARATYDLALKASASGNYDLVIADEINNAASVGLLDIDDLRNLIDKRSPGTSLCLTGRDFPLQLAGQADIITEMSKIKHCYDDGFLAKEGIDY